MRPMVSMPEDDRPTDICNIHKKLVKIARVVLEMSSWTDRHADKPVGFYGPIAPPVPNAPTSRNDEDATFLDPHICHWLLLQRRHAASTDAARYDRREVAGMASFKMYLLRQFCSNRVEIFLQYTGDTDAKNDSPEFWNSNSVIF